MSISSALNSALSGLTASSRQAQVISTNLANALTPGYAARRVDLSTLGDGRGGGVLVDGVTRQVDETLLSDRRLADSDLANGSVKSQFYANLERVFGTPDSPSSLSSLMAEFEANLISAASRPEEDSRLQAAVHSAMKLAHSFNTLSDHVQDLRLHADANIRQDVEAANTLLTQVQSLNRLIVDARNSGQPAASFEDQRHLVLDDLAQIVPLRVMQRNNGEIAIYTPNGAGLLDGSPAELTFEAATAIMPHMILDNGLLSGLRINGFATQTDGSRSPIAGGRLAANFELRDQLATDAQTQLDAIARDLVERFQDAGLDTTRAVGAAGLFTDQGAAFDPSDEVGLAGRMTLNNAVLPDQGGAYWRLRDGLGAAVPGPSGEAALLQGLSDALTHPGALASGNLSTAERRATGHVSSLTSYLGQERLAAERNLSFVTAQQNGLRETELAMGVNSDDELQRMLLIEQSYGANARMIQIVDDMLETLLRI